MALEAGTNLGPYEILSPLGAGGMGEVYRAKDSRLKREVAVKVLLASTATDADALSRFQREAEAVAALSHPNILAIHDVGREGDLAYLVTELLEGETLRTRLDQSAILWPKAVEFGVAIADGLTAAHAKGIIHRDLKPANIFLTHDGVVKILDFGLARVASTASATDRTVTLDTQPGTVLGTARYMSPEQARGQQIDRRTDIFAFGCVLYEMIAGKPAFCGDTFADVMTAILTHDPPSVSESVGGVVPELGRTISRCLEKNPRRRFQSSDDLAFTLRNIRSGIGQVHGISATGTSDTAGDSASIAVLAFTNMSHDPDNDYFSDGISEEIINSLAKLDGLRVAARTSAFSFKGQQVDVAEVGRKLNVSTVLEGSVRQAGDRLRITAQLINVADGYQLWSERFDRRMDDIFCIQDEIATSIAQHLKRTLRGGITEQLVKPPTRNLEAYDVYLKGRSTWQRFGTGLYLALDCFQRAVELDPDFALAHAGIADTYALLGITAALPPREAMPKAKSAAKRALELDDGLAEAHCALASVYLYYEWDWSLAKESFLRSLKLNPNYVQSMFHYGHMYLAFVSQELDQGIQLCRRAVEIDPLAAYALHGWLANLYIAGKTEEAIGPLCEALERDPSAFNLRRLLGLCYLEQSMIEDARNAIETAVIVSGRHPWALYELGMLYVKLGETAEAEAIQAEMVARSQSSYIPATTLAIIPATLGRYDEAFGHLNCGFDERDGVILTITNWPPLRPLRVDSRYDEVLKRLGLENPPEGRLAGNGNE